MTAIVKHGWTGVLAVLCGGLALMEAMGQQEVRLQYPETKKVDVVDDYHGVTVADPYRWLEEDVRQSKEVAAWVEAQNKVTFAYLESIPQREAIRRRITELWNYEKMSAPVKVGGRYFFTKNDGLQNQSVLYVQDRLDGPARLLLDPNTWSKDGTVAISGTAFSEDGRYLAYGVAEAGSDWTTWKVLDVDSGKPLADELKWIKFSSASWTPDGKGFFYSRFPEPPPGAAYQSLNLNMKLYYHRLGTPQSEDVLVYHRPDQPRWGINATVTEDGRYLIISVNDGTTSRKVRIVYKDLMEPYGLPIELIDNHDNKYFF
ncbi:MAG: S9 family peptidase, partial [Gemmataceae bacterium]|nr:S9 family peptidase [Gemmataceae bacterium]